MDERKVAGSRPDTVSVATDGRNRPAAVSEVSDTAKEPQLPLGLFGLDALLEKATRLANSDAPVLLLGETGAGKSSLARWIHAHSVRRQAPLLVHGCGNVHEASFVATLFGWQAGAYTDARAAEPGLLRRCDGGTLILDDIDNLSIESQARLLHFMDTGTVTPLGAPGKVISVDVRLLATSNRDLVRDVRTGRFREDLYYRLSQFPLHLPRIRDRQNAIHHVVRHFENELEHRHPQLWQDRRISECAIHFLHLLELRGNLRELRSIVFQVLAFADGTTTSGKQISLHEAIDIIGDTPGGKAVLDELRDRALEEPSLLHRILEISAGNVALAAKASGISRVTIHKRIKQRGWRFQSATPV